MNDSGAGGEKDAVEMMASLHRRQVGLESLLAWAVAALILLALGLNLVLYKEAGRTRAAVERERQISVLVMKDFHEKRETAIRNFVRQLEGYAEREPDFRPVLDKYRPYLGQYFAPPGREQSK